MYNLNCSCNIQGSKPASTIQERLSTSAQFMVQLPQIIEFSASFLQVMASLYQKGKDKTKGILIVTGRVIGYMK